MVRLVNGIHVKRVRTIPVQLSKEGRVHIFTWTGFDRGWRPACHQSATQFNGEMLDDASLVRVTCRNCMRTGLVPVDWMPMEAE